MNELITCKAAAAMLGLPARTFCDWMADGTIHPDCIFRFEGKRPRIRKAEFMDLYSLGIIKATEATAVTEAKKRDIYAPLHDQ